MSAAALLSPVAWRRPPLSVIAAEVSVSDERGWRIMRSLRVPRESSWHKMLAANSTLPPRLKYTLAPESWAVELRAECLDSESGLARCCERFMRGAEQAEAGGHSPAAEVEAAEWIELCESAGWKAEARANHSVVIPLPSGRHIRIESRDGAVRGVVELGGIALDENPATRARELLLLTLGHEMRMVRPLLRVRAAGSHMVAEIEAGFSHKPEAEQWQHALSALAVAAAACADIFDAFSDEDLASRYLAIREPQQRPPV